VTVTEAAARAGGAEVLAAAVSAIVNTTPAAPRAVTKPAIATRVCPWLWRRCIEAEDTARARDGTCSGLHR
jgi:hypothetical protein